MNGYWEICLENSVWTLLIMSLSCFLVSYRRPPGKPTEQVRSFDMQEKIKRKKQLEAFVKSEEAELEQLRREVSNGRTHIQDLDRVLDTQVNKLLSVYMREKQYQAELQSHLDQLTKEVQ